MKQLLLLSLLSICVISFGQVPNYVPTDSLVGWWPFTGNANDESVNGNNGTVNSATLISDRFGSASEAYSFDGSSSLITIPHQASLDITGSALTVSYWVSISNSPVDGIAHHMVYKADYATGPNGFRIWLKDNNVQYYMADGSYTTAKSVAASVPTNLPLNTWTNFVFTNDNTDLKLYVNGVLIAQTLNAGTVIGNANGSPLYFGGPNIPTPTTDGYFQGNLDDIGMWNRALDQCEIQDLYNSQLSSTIVDAGISQTICNGASVTLAASNSMNYTWNNSVVDGTPFSPTSTSNYIVTADSAGCTSIDSLTITVNQPSAGSISETAVGTYTSPSGIVYDSTGVYNDTILNAVNCDSVITINLTITPTSISELDNSFVKLFPNPSNGIVTLALATHLNGQVVLTDIIGKEVLRETFNSNQVQLDLTRLDAKGTYFVKVLNADGNVLSIKKLIYQ